MQFSLSTMELKDPTVREGKVLNDTEVDGTLTFGGRDYTVTPGRALDIPMAYRTFQVNSRVVVTWTVLPEGGTWILQGKAAKT